MPLALAGFKIDRDEALAKQSVPRTMAAIVVAGWELDRQIHDSQLLVHRYLRPDAGISGICPGIVFPSI